MIEFTCPHCSSVLQIPEQYLGQSGRCNRCQKEIVVTVAPPPMTMESDMTQESVESTSLADLAGMTNSGIDEEPKKNIRFEDVMAVNETLFAQGVQGALELTGNKLTIVRKGVMSALTHGLKGNKEIQITQISSIQLKKPGFMNGYIQFGFLGGRESKGGLMDAASDENTVMFTRAQAPHIIRIKEEIERLQSQPQEVSVHQPSSSSNLDDLEKLAALRDKGIVSEEEFEKKKQQILGL